MVTLSCDTSPHVERMQIGYLRRLPAYRKPALVGEINRMVEGRAMAGLRQRHPDGTQQQRRRRLAVPFLGSELVARA